MAPQIPRVPHAAVDTIQEGFAKLNAAQTEAASEAAYAEIAVGHDHLVIDTCRCRSSAGGKLADVPFRKGAGPRSWRTRRVCLRRTNTHAQYGKKSAAFCQLTDNMGRCWDLQGVVRLFRAAEILTLEAVPHGGLQD
jgi:hypothetical protein